MRRSRRLVSLLTLLTALALVAAALRGRQRIISADDGRRRHAGGGAATTAGGAATTGRRRGAPRAAVAPDVEGSAEITARDPHADRRRRQQQDRPALRRHRPRRPVVQRRRGAGLDKAKADFGITADESTPTGPTAATAPSACWLLGDGLIVGVGFLWGDAITPGAREPDQNFGIVDSVVNIDPAGRERCRTCCSMVFAEEQGSFLVGAAAACASRPASIGFIGGVENDLIKKFEAGYTAGAKQSTLTSRST